MKNIDRRINTKPLVLSTLLLFGANPLLGALPLSETTWGGNGSDVSDGVATAADGTSYVVGISDSFTTDQFGNPSARIFLVKFAANGSLVWQRMWNGTTVRGIGRTGVALGAGMAESCRSNNRRKLTQLLLPLLFSSSDGTITRAICST